MRQSWIVLAFSAAAYCYSSPYECSPKKIEKLLEQIPSWNFDITALANARGNRAYHAVAAYVIEQLFPVTDILRLKKKKEIQILRNVIEDLSKKFDNIYHNSLHAADVLQAVAVFLPKAKTYLSSFDTVTLLLAALSIGAGRPKFTSKFYNSDMIKEPEARFLSERENAVVAVRIMKKAGLFSKVSHDYSFRDWEKRITDLIIATDFEIHYIDEFKRFIANQTSFTPQEAGRLISIIVLKLAIYSNIARPFPISYEWSRLYFEQLFRQSDYELAIGRQPTVFLRNTHHFPKREIEFIEECLDDFILCSNFFNTPFLVENMKKNIDEWRQLSDKWIIPDDNFFLYKKF